MLFRFNAIPGDVATGLILTGTALVCLMFLRLYRHLSRETAARKNDRTTFLEQTERLQSINKIAEEKLKNADEALRQTQELFHNFMNHSPTLAFLKDEGGRYVYVNETFERLENIKLAEIKGKTDFDWLPDHVARELKTDDETVLKGGQSKVLEVTEKMPVSDGSMRDWLAFKFLVKADGDKRFIGGVCVDISELKQAEEAIRRANAELELRVQDRTRELDAAIKNMQAEIMARKRVEKDLARRAEELAASNQELEQFALVASHDLQEPLRKISNYGDLLERRYAGRLDERADKFIGYMVDGARRMQNLIRDLLTYARAGKTDLPFEPVDLNQIVNRIIADLEELIRENNATVTLGPLPTVLANPGQMGQLIQNLLTNALKFRGQAAPRIHIAAAEKDGEWVLTIKDNGIGIETGHMEQIFHIFQRLHGRSEFPGTGIGLAVCKKIIDRHGGHMWANSCKGKGSTFYFTVPIPSERAAAATALFDVASVDRT